MLRWIFMLIGLLLLATGSATAQQIRGTVTDVTTEEPLAGALLVVLDADSVIQATTLSDVSGAFTLRPSIREGIRVRVQRIGYATVESLPLNLPLSGPLQLEIRLRPQPVALEGVTATGELRIHPNLERFLRRQRTGFGQYLGPEEIAKIQPKLTSMLLYSMPGAGSGAVKSSLSGRGIAASVDPKTGLPCPRIYVDGFMMKEYESWQPHESYIPIDSHVPANAVRAVEVYKNAANAPSEFQRAFSNCAVVLIWTDIGFGFGVAK